MEKLIATSDNSVKWINIDHSSKDDNLWSLIDRLKKTGADFNSSENSENIVNNPNFLLLLETLINSIDIDKLIEKDREFFFSLLLNIHSRIFSLLHLWFLNKSVDKKIINRFLEKMKIKIEFFWEEYNKTLNSFDDIINSIKESYKNIIHNNNENSEIIWNLIIETILQIDNLDISFLDNKNLYFINEIAFNSKLKLEKILKLWINDPLKLIIEEKLIKLNNIIQYSSNNYVNDISINTNNTEIILDTIEILIKDYEELRKNSEKAVYLDNEFTENILSILESITFNNYNYILKIPKNISYILTNIAWTRENIPENMTSKIWKEYSNNILNHDFVKRSDVLYDIFYKKSI